MKKVLLTTTAMTLLAGAAAADVSLSGYGRIGVTYNQATATTATYSRFRLNITGTTETDGGLTFGAWTRLQTTSGGATMGAGSSTSAFTFTTTGSSVFTHTVTHPNQNGFSGHTVWVSNGTMTLTLGNTGGAVAQTAGIWGCGVGFNGQCNDMADNSFGNHATNSSTGSGTSIVRLDFALGSANVSVSGGNGSASEVAVGFSAGSMNVSGGYVDSTTPTTFLNASFDAGSATIGIRGASNSTGTGYIAHVTYGMGAGAIYAYAGNNLAGSDEFGVEYSHSLGGGVTASVAVYSTGGSIKASGGAHFNF